MKRNVTDLMRIKLNSLFFLLALSATSLSAAPKQVALQYKIIFLGTFGGNQTIATAINDLDDVAGYSQLTDPTNTTGAQNAFWNKNNKLVDLDPKDTYSGLGNQSLRSNRRLRCWLTNLCFFVSKRYSYESWQS